MSVEVQPYLPLLYRIAGYRHYNLRCAGIRHIELDELIDEGYVGLAQAGSTFDQVKSDSFETYAAYKIHYAISYYLRTLDIIDFRLRALINKLKRQMDKFHAQHGRFPDAIEVANLLSLSAQKAKELMFLLTVDENLNNPQDIEESNLQSFDLRDIDVQLLTKDTDICIETMQNETLKQILILKEVRGLKLKEIAALMGAEYTIVKVHRYNDKAKELLIECLEGKGWTVLDIRETLE